MEEKVIVKTSGIGLTSILGVVFVVLKLTGYITWSWWWVTLPFWGPWVLAFILAAVIRYTDKKMGE